MAVYSFAQLEQLWINAGGPSSVADIAAAIGLAESSGNSEATNPNDNHGTQTSWGIWQISNGTHNQPVPNILDPTVNAQQAVAKFHGAGNSFSPWGTFGSGAYLSKLQSGVAPSSAGVPAGSSSATLTAADTGPDPGSAQSVCLVGLPSGTPFVGGACLMTKTEARAFVGAALLGVGILVGVVALVVLARGGSATSAAATVASPATALVRHVRSRPRTEPDEPEPDDDEE